MTIMGWILFGIIALVILTIGVGAAVCLFDNKIGTAVTIFATVLVVAGILAGMLWFFSHTASGRRAMVDQKSDLNNGIERTITVYTADGKEIASYSGNIDISSADGYVKFDFNGKRYIYYNCFVESIAEIPN
jgi:uncharacterized protein YxeA